MMSREESEQFEKDHKRLNKLLKDNLKHGREKIIFLTLHDSGVVALSTNNVSGEEVGSVIESLQEDARRSPSPVKFKGSGKDVFTLKISPLNATLSILLLTSALILISELMGRI